MGALSWKVLFSIISNGAATYLSVKAPLNVVDALIFSTLSYLHFPDAGSCQKTITEIRAATEPLPDDERFRGLGVVKEDSVRLLRAAAECRRYRDVKLTNYVEITDEETEKQFSAVTFILPSKSLFIAYRGTDSSLVGWKEDFNMAFLSGTPAQLEATEYAVQIAEAFPDMPIQLGGQSKGGNLAVWAAVHLPQDIKHRVTHVYNNDGPGFADDLTGSPEYLEMSGKIVSVVPESSIVGVLMGGCDHLTIKSTTLSVLQHNPFTWKVVGKRFVYATDRSDTGKRSEKKINDLISSMDHDQISALVEKIYNDLTSSDEKTLKDLKKHLFRHIVTTLTAIKRSKPKKKTASTVGA